MSTVRSRRDVLPPVLLAAVCLVVGFRLWSALCFFPLAEWNDVRLAPTFMAWFGPTPYPGPDAGPLTTWIYGPVPLLLNLPALLAADPAGALLVAGGINLLGAVLPAAAAVFLLGAPLPDGLRTDRAWALLMCVALWPNTALQYLQADNAAVAFGLLSNVVLLRARAPAGRPPVAAAVLVALAVWSKQTMLALVVAQLVWLAVTVGWRPAARHALGCLVAGLALGGAFAAWFGFDGLWLNLVTIPGRLPFGEDPWARTRDFWLQLAGGVLLPAVCLVVFRRAIWRRDSPWLLPALSWIGLLPLGLAAAYRIGGATNSLYGFLFLLPAAALAGVATLRRMTLRAPAWLAAGVAGIVLEQLASSPVVPLRPLTAHLTEAGQLAQEFRGRIYFPWHPLVTFYAERRVDHAEDGLHTRQLAGAGLSPAAIRRHLPPAWSVTAIPGWRDRGVYKSLQPANARLEVYGKWLVYSWRPGEPASTASPP